MKMTLNLLFFSRARVFSRNYCTCTVSQASSCVEHNSHAWEFATTSFSPHTKSQKTSRGGATTFLTKTIDNVHDKEQNLQNYKTKTSFHPSKSKKIINDSQGATQRGRSDWMNWIFGNELLAAQLFDSWWSSSSALSLKDEELPTTIIVATRWSLFLFKKAKTE